MDWVWKLYKPYIYKQFARDGVDEPSDDQVQACFMKTLSQSSLTLLVQEPWQGSVRFKELARYEWGEMMPVIERPLEYLSENFGGGKYKINFHQGYNFVCTQNFKPDGQPLWKDMPDLANGRE